MKCSKCGNEIKNGAKFCNICGQSVSGENIVNDVEQNVKPSVNLNKNDENKDNVVANPPKKNKTLKAVIGVFLVIVVGLVIGVIASESDSGYVSEDVLSVKNGYFEAYPSDQGYTDIGTAFDGYFADTSWESFTSEEGMEIVQFDGEFMYYDDETDCSLQFETYEDGTFEIYAVEYNGIPQNKLEIASLVEEVMENSLEIDN